MPVHRYAACAALIALIALIACSSSEPPDGGASDATAGGRDDARPGDAMMQNGNRDAEPDRDAAPGAELPPGVDIGARDAGGGVPLSALSDEFEGGALDPSWSALHGETVDISVHDGALFLRPNQSILWFNGSEGMQLSKKVTGDFKATSTVHARKASNPSVPPDVGPDLGGVMARNPSAPPENYVFIVVGHDQDDVSVETKSTMSSNSVYQGPTWPSGDAELRVCRVGGAFMLFKRAIGDTTWQTAMAYTRPDLPATLDVGPNAYAYLMGGGVPDFVVSFDRFAFANVGGMADCTVDP
jgi:hypothetical protein